MSERRPLALITGGTSGIGLGVARALASHYDLALGYASDDAKAQAATAAIPGAITFKQPLRSAEDAARLAETVTKELGRSPLVLVNSAGRLDDGLFLDLDFSRHAAIVTEHLVCAMALTHACLKGMMREKFGRIVNLSSISATYAKRGQSNYAAAKAGLEGFTKTLALEVAHRGITVNAVAPGLIDTPMTASILAKMADDPKALRKRIPAGYAGTPDDVGALVAYLCSPGARYITGQTLTIDGGRSLGDPES